MRKPVILCDPWPRTLDLMFSPDDRACLEDETELIVSDAERMPAAMIEQHLPEADFVMGVMDMPAARLDAAPRLRAILNVEGNFLPNVDYDTCFTRGIHVLSVSPVFAEPVAETALGMAISLGRDIHRADRDFHEGREGWGLESNQGVDLLFDAPVGLIGFGDLARAFRPLLAPFRTRVSVYDPWVPDHIVERAGCRPADLDTVLSTSRFIFCFATVTADNEGFLRAEHFARMQKGASFILVGRAAFVDFEAMIDAVARGHIRVATDVFPEEPMPPDHRVRQVDGMLLSAHRAGAVDAVFKQMGTLLLGDIRLMMQGLPPVGLKRAQRETVGSLRSMAVTKS